jgi:signal transduction histidine kinase
MQDLLTTERAQDFRRFAELGRMSAVLLHEISNPLTAALLNLEASDHKSTAIRQARRDIRLIKRYVEAARSHVRRQSTVTVFCVQPQLNHIKRLSMPLAKQAGVQVSIQSLAGCRLRGDPVKFLQIVSNLVMNALDAHQEAADSGRFVNVTLSRNDA